MQCVQVLLYMTIFGQAPDSDGQVDSPSNLSGGRVNFFRISNADNNNNNNNNILLYYAIVLMTFC